MLGQLAIVVEKHSGVGALRMVQRGDVVACACEEGGAVWKGEACAQAGRVHVGTCGSQHKGYKALRRDDQIEYMYRVVHTPLQVGDGMLVADYLVFLVVVTIVATVTEKVVEIVVAFVVLVVVAVLYVSVYQALGTG